MPKESAETSFAEALRCEEIAARLHHTDPAKRIFEADAEWWLNDAARRERGDWQPNPPRSML